MSQQTPIGQMLRDWRKRRRLSQLDLALDANISARHLSFLETGRSWPSREMLLRLAERLGVPPREQNALLLAAGFAPVYPERSLDSPELESAKRAVELILRGHEPLPALAIDRHWNMLAANRSAEQFLVGAPDWLLEPPINVVRFSLHPDGLGKRIRNLAQFSKQIVLRLERSIDLTGDEVLIDLLNDVRSYPVDREGREQTSIVSGEVAIPFELEVGDDVQRFWSTTTVFGTPLDITLAELAIEAFYPADADTARALGIRADDLKAHDGGRVG